MNSQYDYISLIILAAGCGTRMQCILNTPKQLAIFCGEPLLQRTLRQFHEIGVHNMLVVTGYEANNIASAAYAVYPDVKIVHNEKYDKDRNILSLLLSIRQIPKNCGIFIVEGDVLLPETSIMSIASLPKLERSVWTACGHFRHGQKGGILLPQEDGQIKEIRYSIWDESLAHWYKNLGIIYIAPDQVQTYYTYLEEYASRSLDYYFMTPWQEHLDELPAWILDLGEKGGATFNTPEEYEMAQKLVSKNSYTLQKILLYELKHLRHIEHFDSERVCWLAQKIANEHFWTKPLAISRKYDLVMDGQHRMEAARQLGLKRVPVIFFDYEHISVYSLRPEYEVTSSEIISRALTGNIYPYKTAKHILPEIPNCHIPLEELR